MTTKPSDILTIHHLSVSIPTNSGTVEAVRDVSLTLQEGEVLALCGESGCGKSMLCRAVMGLLPKRAVRKAEEITADGFRLHELREKEMRQLRGNLFSMIFQDPLTALDPAMTVGSQIAEALLIHNRRMKTDAVQSRIIELLTLVGIDHPEERMKLYPYNLSGGQRQRIVFAIALANNPKILFADEPTTALDVTIQAQIIDLLRDVQNKLHTTTILVTHDLGVAARAADRIAIMYAGRIVEIGTAEEIFYDPRHPYTWGLLQSLPALSRHKKELFTIGGMPPTLIDPPKGDAFASRNPYALAIDYEEAPPMFQVSETHFAATWLLDERAPQVERPIGGNPHE